MLRIDPLAADGLVNRGNTFKEMGRVNEAIQDYIRAVTIRPTMAEAHANLASAYKDRYHMLHALVFCGLLFYKFCMIKHDTLNLGAHSGHVEAAIKSYKQALSLRPDFPEATCNLLHTLQVTVTFPLPTLLN